MKAFKLSAQANDWEYEQETKQKKKAAKQFRDSRKNRRAFPVEGD